MDPNAENPLVDVIPPGGPFHASDTPPGAPPLPPEIQAIVDGLRSCRCRRIQLTPHRVVGEIIARVHNPDCATHNEFIRAA